MGICGRRCLRRWCSKWRWYLSFPVSTRYKVIALSQPCLGNFGFNVRLWGELLNVLLSSQTQAETTKYHTSYHKQVAILYSIIPTEVTVAVIFPNEVRHLSLSQSNKYGRLMAWKPASFITWTFFLWIPRGVWSLWDVTNCMLICTAIVTSHSEFSCIHRFSIHRMITRRCSPNILLLKPKQAHATTPFV